MIEVEQAIELLLQHTKRQELVIETDIIGCLQGVLAEDIVSGFSVPNSPRSAMDGYAVRSQDVLFASKENPVKLEVIGKLMAGENKDILGKPKTATRIMTGGVVPQCYDCVIKQEDTDYGTDEVLIYKKIDPWENYCKIGEDIPQGQLIIPKYTRLYSNHIGVMASLGIAKSPILKPMRVGIISTGGELITPGNPLEPAQIYNSCGYMVAAFIKTAGAETTFFQICKDDPFAMEEMVNEAMEKTDLLITTGGVSVGEKDIVPHVLEKLGAKTIFKHVNMKPGTPVLASFYKNKVILSLSGNPFATFANFYLFFWPILEKFMGNSEFGHVKKEAVMKEGQMKASGLRRFVRAFEKNGYVYLPTNNHKATVLSNLAECNCFIDQKPNCELKDGDTVNIFYLK